MSEIAAPFDISLAAVSKHLRVLERARLIEREVRGRTHHCQLNAAPLREVVDWARRYQRFWEERLDALDAFLRTRRQSRRRTP